MKEYSYYLINFVKYKMERYFTTIALLGVDEGNLPVHRYVIKQLLIFILFYNYIEVWDKRDMSQSKRCLISLMFVKELVQSSQSNQCYWTHTIQSGMMTWPICMSITHNTNNTWCISQCSHSCSYIITTCFSTTRISNS